MNGNLYAVVATYVAPGARLRDGLKCVLYAGDDGHEAKDVVDGMVAWALDSIGGGMVIVNVLENDTLIDDHSVSIRRDNSRPVRTTGPGYPAHTCGAPMMPLDLAGVPTIAGSLYCVGCGDRVVASAADRMRSAGAAKAEREARRAS